jgi:hypothetical protein
VAAVEESLDVDVPVNTVYNRWTHVEEDVSAGF